MRPAVLYPLFASVSTLPGIGAKLAKALEKLAGPRVVDLVWHLPSGFVDRRLAPAISALKHREVGTVRVMVVDHQRPRTPRQPYRVFCTDATGQLWLVFFNARPDYLERLLPPGEERIVSGLVDQYGDVLQIVHPDHVLRPGAADDMPETEAVYPLTAGLMPKVLGKAIRAALATVPPLDEWLDPGLIQRHGWPDWRSAVFKVHAPAAPTDLAIDASARRRLAYDELLAQQLALALVRSRLKRRQGRAIRAEGRTAKQVLDRFGFTLTASQRMAIAEILGDMAADAPMLRLLQGDVGSGKTIVALVAMLHAVESGAQAALMAPTEILARQHYATIASLCAGAGVEVALLTGRERDAAREPVLRGLASGTVGIVVGTHALLQEGVVFRDLALSVVDEQHRFGVEQRLELAAKGAAADMLVMSATPIPRTLTMTVYGDLDVSRLTEKPPGRKPVDTRVVPVERLDDVIAGVGRAIDAGAKAYWVCPLVDESETTDAAAAEQRYRVLLDVFPGRVGLVHGRMKTAEREAVLADFRRGPLAVLVATTVIEVGVDVPDATLMIVEHAERFGLAQLHQLRGRVGRGAGASTCVLLYEAPITEAARARLAVLRETDDGFRIAEEDLRLRGAGEVLGVRQSGLPAFRVADLAVHGDLLPTAVDDAKLILARDPELTSPRGRALRVLLYLFERDAAVRNLRSG